MELITRSYCVHQVNFDADILCERCNQATATHYLNGVFQQLRKENRKTPAELCDQCTEHIVAHQIEQTNWALME